MGYGSSFSFGGLTPWVKRLILANVVVFLATWLAGTLLHFDLAGLLAFEPARVLVRPWTVVTYMFVHGGLFHLFFNMLALFFFGPPLESLWGSREFLKFYLICGLGAAALSFLLAFHSGVIGASGAIYGVMLAFAMNWPNAPIYIWGIFPVPAKWLVAIFVAFDLFSGFTGRMDGMAHFAHLGGFAVALVYLKMNRPALANPFGGLKKLKPRKSKPKLTVISGSGSAPKAPARKPRSVEEERMLDDVDRILDKIGASGMGSLTADERRLLDEVSKRFRHN